MATTRKRTNPRVELACRRRRNLVTLPLQCEIHRMLQCSGECRRWIQYDCIGLNYAEDCTQLAELVVPWDDTVRVSLNSVTPRVTTRQRSLVFYQLLGNSQEDDDSRTDRTRPVLSWQRHPGVLSEYSYTTDGRTSSPPACCSWTAL